MAFSNLNLNGQTPTRVQPKVGSWGPEGVPSTRHKKIMRVVSIVVFTLALVALVAFGTWIYFEVFKNPQG